MFKKIIFICRALIILFVVGMFGCLTISDECGVTSVEWEEERISGNNEKGTVNREQRRVRADGLEVEVFPQLGHLWDVNTVAFSPDGKQVLSGSNDNTIKLWDITTGRLIRTFVDHSGSVISVAFSPDGMQILSGSTDRTIKLWNTTTGCVIRSFSGHRDKVNSVAFSPDGKMILSGSDDQTMQLFDSVTGEKIFSFIGHTGFRSVAFSPDGRQVLSGSRSIGIDDYETIKLWDIATGNNILTFTGQNNITSVAFSPDGSQILSGSLEGSIKLWDATTGREIKTFLGHTRFVNSVCFSPDGKQVLSGSADGTIRIWNIATGQEIKTFFEPIRDILSVVFSPDGKYILSGFRISSSRSVNLKLYEVTTGNEKIIFADPTTWVFSVAFSPDGKQILSGLENGTMKLWNAVVGNEIRTFTGAGAVQSVAFDSDGKQILSGSMDGTVKLWNTITGQEIMKFSGHTSWVTTVAFSPSCKQVLSGSSDRTMRLWNSTTGQEIRSFLTQERVESMVFSPDGRQILTNSTNILKIWDVETGLEFSNFLGRNQGATYSVNFSPDGNLAISGSGGYTSSTDGIYTDVYTVNLWDLATGRKIKSFSGHTDVIRSVAFSPDGKYILSGSGDYTIKLWDIDSGKNIKTFTGHTDSVYEAMFSKNGKLALSCSRDGTTRIWDIETGEEIASFISFNDGEWIVITPDGFFNASPKGDQHLNVRIGNNVYGMDQFHKTFYRPDVVERRLQGLEDPDDIKGISIIDVPIPPLVTVTPGEVDNETGIVTLTINTKDEVLQITDIEIIINGRLVGGEELMSVSGNNINPLNTRLIPALNENLYQFTVDVKLDPGLNRIEIVSSNHLYFGLGFLDIAYIRLDSQEPPKGNLYILAIGVNNYTHDRISNLRFAVSDARRIVSSFKEQEGEDKRFNEVIPLLITDRDDIKPTKQNIIDNLKFLQRAGPNDVALLYIAAHGITDEKGIYYFFPSDTTITENRYNTDSGIDINQLITALDIPCRKIIMLDTCESGGVDSRGVDNNRLARELRNRSTVILTASQYNEDAIERLGHFGGYFTTGVVQGIRGEAGRGNILINSLGSYVEETVKRISENQQKPVSLIPDGFRNFVISIVE